MVEKNILLTTKDKNTGEIVVLRPSTSIGNVEGLSEYVTRKLNQFLTNIKGIFVVQEEGKSLSSNDFTDKYREQLDNLVVNNVTNIEVNGKTVESIDGTVTITTEEIVDTLSEDDIETIFKNI